MMTTLAPTPVVLPASFRDFVEWEQRLLVTEAGRMNRKFWLQQGRAVLRVTPTYSSGLFFLQAQVELVGNKDQSASPPLATTDDLWVDRKSVV